MPVTRPRDDRRTSTADHRGQLQDRRRNRRRAAEEFGNQVVLAARSEDTLGKLADELGGDEGAGGALRRDELGGPAGARSRRARGLRPPGRLLRERRLRRRARLPRGVRRALEVDDRANVLGAALSIRALSPLAPEPRPPDPRARSRAAAPLPGFALLPRRSCGPRRWARRFARRSRTPTSRSR